MQKLLLSIVFILNLTLTYSYETDQYSSMFYDLPESSQTLDAIVNKTIDNTIKYYEGVEDNNLVINLIKRSLNARQLEKWVNDNPNITSWNNLSDSIYKTVAWFNSPIIRFKGLANTFVLNGVHVGADKMSHFFGVGGIYYQKAEVEGAQWSEEKKIKKIAKYGRWTEKMQWGELTTNVFSNADLIVNYEGYLFYKSLFEDDIVSGKGPILTWDNGKLKKLRDFTFEDHVTDFWSEALLPNWYQLSLRRRVLGVLRTYCLRDDYLLNPQAFVPRNKEELFARYSKLGINMKAMRFRMDNVCTQFENWSPKRKEKYISKQFRRIEKMSLKIAGKKAPVEEQIEDLNDYESILKVIGSPFPGCNKHIAVAVREHELIEEWNEGINFVVDNFILEKYGIDFENKKSVVDLYISSLQEIESKINVGQRNLTKINDNHIETAYEILKTGGMVISNLKYKLEVTDETLKVCFTSKVPLLDDLEELRYENMEVHLMNCQERNYTSRELKRTNQYMVVKPGKTFWSDDDFYSRDDKLGYVYRNIPYLCKWY
ncbi:MAG: hypothetical protein GY909_17655 [Oligoflexia bacterium]|nr:hypothetical protein [Oligoflexia bacterium]